MTTSITVLKFGGSVLRSEDDLPRAVHEIYRHWRRGSRVLTVVSAFGGTTDRLIEKSKAFGEEPHPAAFASLLFTGEATSAALLALALKRAGVPSKLLSPEHLGMRTTGDALDAEPVEANVERLRNELEHAVVIVSGFAGINGDGDLTLLGRGGTDLAALFLAQQLEARCVLLKDVAGLYESNPSNNGINPQRFASASYETALRLGGELVQPKAVLFARANRKDFEIASIGASSGTVIGDLEDKFARVASRAHRPLRVALLGCGTVGGGVYQRLAALPEFFEIVGVVNLDPHKAVASGVHEQHIRSDARSLIERDCDVVIELIGGIAPAREFIEHALKLGRHVVTANKALLADAGDDLRRLANECGVTIRYSASVGGALPALEAVAGNGSKPRIVKGIINGTCNFICDQLASGSDFDSAVRLAQEEGFAEADPTLDLDGTDAAQKLVLLVRESFGISLPLTSIERKGIEGLVAKDVWKAALRGSAYRLIAEYRQTASGVHASVKPAEFPSSHVFAKTKGAENCLVIEDDGGKSKVLTGRGAGRYATTEAVIADLFDVLYAVEIRTNAYKEAAA